MREPRRCGLPTKSYPPTNLPDFSHPLQNLNFIITSIMATYRTRSDGQYKHNTVDEIRSRSIVHGDQHFIVPEFSGKPSKKASRSSVRKASRKTNPLASSARRATSAALTQRGYKFSSGLHCQAGQTFLPHISSRTVQGNHCVFKPGDAGCHWDFNLTKGCEYINFSEWLLIRKAIAFNAYKSHSDTCSPSTRQPRSQAISSLPTTGISSLPITGISPSSTQAVPCATASGVTIRTLPRSQIPAALTTYDSKGGGIGILSFGDEIPPPPASLPSFSFQEAPSS